MPHRTRHWNKRQFLTGPIRPYSGPQTNNGQMLLSTTNGERYRAGLLLALCCSLFVPSPRCEAQNLVPNPSFELMDTCPYTIGFQEGDRPQYWLSWSQSPEYFHACAVNTLVSVPQNGWGYQDAWDGNAYVGMLAYSMGDDFREYVGVELIEPLEVGQRYSVRMRANLAMDGDTWPSNVACDRLGILFTMQPNGWTEIPGPGFSFRNYAHVHSNVILSDTANWSLISGSFIADSTYRYLVIGNFFEDDHTDTLNLDNGPTAGAYYYVDSISVSLGSTGIGIQESSPSLGVFLDETVGELRLKWEVGKQAKIVLVDATGRTVRSQLSATGHLAWSVSDLMSGVYAVCLNSKEGRSILRFVQH